MRYFFHIRDDQGLVADDEGSELPDLAAAKAEARHNAGNFVMENLRCGQRASGRWVEIADGDGQVLDRFLIRDVIN